MEREMTNDIPTTVGAISMEEDGEDLFLLMSGVRVAKRGPRGTRKAKKWIPIVPWVESVIDESDSSLIIRYAHDKVGRA
jgi:hypothetical protein